MTMKLQIRQSNSPQFEVEIATDATVLQLKEACQAKCEVPPESQRLIYKGKLNWQIESKSESKLFRKTG